MAVNPQARLDTPPEHAAGHGWHARFRILLFIVFAFEIGFFLLVFPWLQGWEHTSIPLIVPWLASVWRNPFFRGAISGLGAVNIYISMLEVGRLRRGA